MTEQPPPSAEAQALAETIYKWQGYAFLDGRVAQAIDALILQRVAAETERWQNRDRQRLDQIDRLQETVQQLQSALAERPVGDYTERARELLRRIGDAHGRETQSRYYEDNKPSVKLVVDALS